MRGDNHCVIEPIDAVDHDQRQMRKQNPATAFKSHGPRAPRPRSSGQSQPLHAMCARTNYRDHSQITLKRRALSPRSLTATSAWRRLMTQIARVMDINHLDTISPDAVHAAR
jgi:hypothetical protein